MEKKARRRRSVSSRTFIVMLALVLVIGCAVGGTVAWLVSSTNAVVNTFTYGAINITLSETTGENDKIIPGKDISKDPKVTVKKDSEACWLFVGVKEEGTFVADKVTYSVADGWTKGDGTKIPANVYYREVAANDANQEFPVLKDNKITVSNTLTKIDIKDILTTTPKLSITAYAIQKDGMDTAAMAWAAIPGTTTDTTQP